MVMDEGGGVYNNRHSDPGRPSSDLQGPVVVPTLALLICRHKWVVQSDQGTIARPRLTRRVGKDTWKLCSPSHGLLRTFTH